jgi:hypothetical protein
LKMMMTMMTMMMMIVMNDDNVCADADVDGSDHDDGENRAMPFVGQASDIKGSYGADCGIDGGYVKGAGSMGSEVISGGGGCSGGRGVW